MATSPNKKSSPSTKRRSTSKGTSKNSSNRRKTTATKDNAVEFNPIYHDEITVVVTLVISILLILSNFNLSGTFGVYLNYITFGFFGFISYILPYILFVSVAFRLSNRGNKKANSKLISCISLMILLTAFLQLLSMDFDSSMSLIDYYKTSASEKNGGGMIGGILLKILCPFFGTLGAYVILIAVMIILLMFITEKAFFRSLGKKGSKAYENLRERQQYYKEQRDLYESEYEENEEQQSDTKRKMKTVNLKRPNQDTADTQVNIDNSTYDSHEEKGFFKSKRAKNKLKKLKADDSNATKSGYDMDEVIQKEDHITPLTSNSLYKEESIPVYEEELRRKFNNKGNDYDISALANHLMQDKDLFDDSAMNGDIKVSNTNENQQDCNQMPFDEEPMGKVHTEDENPVFSWDNDITSDNKNSATDLDNPIQGISANNNSAVQEPKRENATKLEDKQEEKQQNLTLDNKLTIQESTVVKKYEYPPLSLLSKPKPTGKGNSEKELKETAFKLQKTLESFGVRVTITNVSCGPAVTRYELQPEQGVKVSKITSLADDIKLNLAAADIRIEAPIPGKAAVGIEVPNKVNTAVMFRELIENPDFTNHPSDLAFAVGKDIGGKTIVTDIAKMPHLLIAGATGSGKSVCINTLIMSILYKANPADVKLIMVDPKVVELSVYNGIPHLLIPVVTDPKKASAALNWAVMEMTDRYQKFAELGVRDLKGYNEKVAKVEHLEDERYQKMPQIVIIVDELADLMMVAPGEVEDAICRLAQMARAAGLHLIIATQRPSVNVITGLIKANVPSRIAFSVSSAIDSRTIIDGSGAEKLLGKGDMLFFPSGYPKPVRIQGAFVSDKEVSDVVEFLSSQNIDGKSGYSEEISSKITSVESIESVASSTQSDRDDYFIEAGKFIIDKDKASIGMLQRVYKIGFNRAARIMDQLYEAGVVGPEEGTKPRKVLMSMEEFEQYVDEYV
ncbi:FtsK/SpoIIIE family DNA translocase [Anaeromicropila herbilytica]|uniref:FtsK domain-containing protein n=1 Tax=Anaeromicropila herbilytica TaxID=2785025 RepID=A0A7R7IDY8_9FIRM|nr:DNA translocase FtsK [Anaeromicropila herbilytica]BCN31446.1 hypothetical protein bsdtb5_27410 [Anaeromicropila herbilytica]